MADVYVAQGHGRRPDGSFDPGASDGSHTEQRDSKPVVEAAVSVLRGAGLEVISEAEMADDPNFYGTTDAANEASVDCVVSFHYDWNQAPPGAFAIATSDDGRELGWAMEERVKDAGFGIRDYPDDRDDLYLLNNTAMPAVIFECGRIGHEDIDEVDEQRAMGEAAALGILDWLGVEENDLALLTESQQQELAEMLDRLEEIGSSVAYVSYMVPWFRRLSGLDPAALEELEESDEIAALDARIDELSASSTDSVARRRANAAHDRLDAIARAAQE